MVRQRSGPTRPGTDVSRFRGTGVSRPRASGGSVVGPTRPGTDVEIFRATGKSVAIGSAESTRLRLKLQAQAQQKAQAKAQAELSAKQKAESKRREIARITQLNKAREIRIRRQQKEFGKILASKTIIQKKKFLLDQKQLSRAIDIQRIQDSGRKITPKQQRILDDAKRKFLKKEEKIKKEVIETPKEKRELGLAKSLFSGNIFVRTKGETQIRKALPFGIEPFSSRDADFFIKENDKLVSVKPKTLVGAVTSAFEKGVSLTDRQIDKLERKTGVKIPRGKEFTLGDAPGQLVLLSLFDPALVSTTTLRTANIKLKDPTIRFSGTGQEKFTKKTIKNLDSGFVKDIKNKRVTNRVGIEIKIPNLRGEDRVIKLIQFEKNGKVKFFGQEFFKGKPIKNIRGSGLVKDSDTITKIVISNIKKSFRGKVKKAEVRTFLERMRVIAKKQSEVSFGALTSTETRLASKLKLKKLKPEEFRNLIRKELGEKAFRGRSKKPFTKKEFAKAKRLSRTDILSRLKIIKIKQTKQIRVKSKIGKKSIEDVKSITKTVTPKKFKVKKTKDIKIVNGLKKPTRVGKSIKTEFKFIEKGEGFSRELPLLPKEKLEIIKIGKTKIKLQKGEEIANAKVTEIIKGKKIKVIREVVVRKRGQVTGGRKIKIIKFRNRFVKKPELRLQEKSTSKFKILLKEAKVKRINIKLKRASIGAQKELARDTQKKLISLFKKKSKISSAIKSIGKSAVGVSQKKKKVLKQKKEKLKKEETILQQAIRQIKAQRQKRARSIKFRFKQKLKVRPPLRGLRPIRIPKPKIIIPFKKKKDIIKKKIKSKKKQGFNVFARPTKKRKGQRKPKLVKVNKVPLSKKRAENLRNFIADTSLARTARITPTILKAKRPQTRVPAGFASKTKNKFRTFRIVKGRRVPLRKGKVIEKRTKLLDTRSEKRGITLRRRIRQITPKKRKMTKTQRDIMLDNLRKGREKRLKNLKGRKNK